MTKWKCSICGWIYDPEVGVAELEIKPGIPFQKLSDDFRCPQCGAMKKWFKEIRD